jgi:hypothetical protein
MTQHWNSDYHVAFENPKQKLMEAPILNKPHFSKTLILNVDWSIKGVGEILFLKHGR